MNIKIDIPDGFLDAEWREGFYIDENKKKVWATQIDLLCEFMRICRKYKIKFVVGCGTLLGAIRHKGYIPFDWDIDVYMLRYEYEKLEKVIQNELEYPYFWSTAMTDRRFFEEHASLHNSETTCIIPWRQSPDCNSGISIDIFPLDGYMDHGDFFFKIQLLKIKVMVVMLRSYYSKEGDLKGIRGWIQHVFKFILPKMIVYEKMLSKLSVEKKKYNDQTEKVTFLQNTTMKELERWSVLKKDIEDCDWVDFEFIKVPIPKNYDAVLKKLYGNYLELPSKERIERKLHSLSFNADISYKKYYKNLLKDGKKLLL